MDDKNFLKGTVIVMDGIPMSYEEAQEYQKTRAVNSEDESTAAELAASDSITQTIAEELVEKTEKANRERAAGIIN